MIRERRSVFEWVEVMVKCNKHCVFGIALRGVVATLSFPLVQGRFMHDTLTCRGTSIAL